MCEAWCNSEGAGLRRTQLTELPHRLQLVTELRRSWEVGWHQEPVHAAPYRRAQMPRSRG
eukprot:6174988-Pleurochrysis_carterae.AAC.3